MVDAPPNFDASIRDVLLLHEAGVTPRSALITAHSRVPSRESRVSACPTKTPSNFTGELVREGSLSKRSRHAPISGDVP